jgi:hypothetical protein
MPIMPPKVGSPIPIPTLRITAQLYPSYDYYSRKRFQTKIFGYITISLICHAPKSNEKVISILFS